MVTTVSRITTWWPHSQLQHPVGVGGGGYVQSSSVQTRRFAEVELNGDQFCFPAITSEAYLRWTVGSSYCRSSASRRRRRVLVWLSKHCGLITGMYLRHQTNCLDFHQTAFVQHFGDWDNLSTSRVARIKREESRCEYSPASLAWPFCKHYTSGTQWIWIDLSYPMLTYDCFILMQNKQIWHDTVQYLYTTYNMNYKDSTADTIEHKNENENNNDSTISTPVSSNNSKL